MYACIHEQEHVLKRPEPYIGGMTTTLSYVFFPTCLIVSACVLPIYKMDHLWFICLGNTENKHKRHLILGLLLSRPFSWIGSSGSWIVAQVSW